MRTDRLNKYIWIVDTIVAHRRITRAELSELWQKSALYDGHDIPHRTFFNYRRDIESIFNIDILCDNLNRYYIDSPKSPNDEAFRSWMLDSFALGSAMRSASEAASRVIVEKIPSARRFLSPILRALADKVQIRFSYQSFSKPLPDRDILYTPYFVKLFRQRWYIVGRREPDGDIRTYALDRISDLNATATPAVLPPDLDPSAFFDDIFGITSSKAEPKDVVLSVNPHTAKYLRALPLHSSQREDRYSDRSIFRLRLRITPDFLREILSMGPDIQVIQPRELRLMVIDSLRRSLEAYNS